jgi:hypothetical protein
VCELEGPIPILNNSKMLTVMIFYATRDLERRRSRLPAPDALFSGDGSRYFLIQLAQLLSLPSITSPPITACMMES